MLEFQWIWRQFPRQITSDLSRFHHLDIADWHDGKLRSYNLICYVENLPEESAFKAALRQGEYTEAEIAQRHHANETARLRATMHAVHGGQRYDPPLLKTRHEQRQEIVDAEIASEQREHFYGFADRTPTAATSDAQGALTPDDVTAWGAVDWDGKEVG